MAYPSTVDELTNGVPADGIAATTALGSVTYPHDDHHRALGVAVEAIETQLVGAYTSYTPTLTAPGGTDPTLGSGSTAVGKYKRLGHRVIGDVSITFGSSGVSAGSGSYGILLPVAPANRDQPIGTGYIMDYSANLQIAICAGLILPAVIPAADRKCILLVDNAVNTGFGTAANPAGSATPWTWAANDAITIKFDYEAASAT